MIIGYLHSPVSDYAMDGNPSLRTLDMLLENHPLGVGRQRSVAAVKRLKAAARPDWVITRPILGELTAVSIGPNAPAGRADVVMAWARSVAAHRYLHLDREQS